MLDTPRKRGCMKDAPGKLRFMIASKKRGFMKDAPRKRGFMKDAPRKRRFMRRMLLERDDV